MEVELDDLSGRTQAGPANGDDDRANDELGEEEEKEKELLLKDKDALFLLSLIIEGEDSVGENENAAIEATKERIRTSLLLREKIKSSASRDSEEHLPKGNENEKSSVDISGEVDKSSNNFHSNGPASTSNSEQLTTQIDGKSPLSSGTGAPSPVRGNIVKSRTKRRAMEFDFGALKLGGASSQSRDSGSEKQEQQSNSQTPGAAKSEEKVPADASTSEEGDLVFPSAPTNNAPAVRHLAESGTLECLRNQTRQSRRYSIAAVPSKVRPPPKKGICIRSSSC